MGGPVFLTGYLFELTFIMHELCSRHTLRALDRLSYLQPQRPNEEGPGGKPIV